MFCDLAHSFKSSEVMATPSSKKSTPAQRATSKSTPLPAISALTFSIPFF